MSRVFVITVLLALVACDEGPDQLCERRQVNNDGVLDLPTLDLNRVRLMTQGEPVTVRVFAPLSSCVSDVLRASAELYDAANAPAEITSIAVEANSGLVQAAVVFSPNIPGSYFLRVSFEPSLGTRSERIEVVGRPSLDAGTTVTLPMRTSDCLEGPWPLSRDAIACEARETPRIDVVSSDGGVQSFEGRHLAVADTTLWSVAPSTSRLERRVLENGVLALTHQLDGFPLRLTPAMHGPHFALRVDDRERLQLINVADDAGASTTTTRHTPRSAPYWFFSDDLRVYVADVTQFPECTGLSDCDALGGLVGVEPGVTWRRDTFDPSRVGGAPWPMSSTAEVRFSLAVRVLPTTAQQGPFERLPLWLEPSAGAADGDAVLASWRDERLSLNLWPHARVLRVGSRFIALTEGDAHTVRLIPSQPP